MDLGGNFIDTADAYCDGNSEEVVGTWLKKMGSRRDELVIATKGRYVNDLNHSSPLEKLLILIRPPKTILP